MLSNKILLAIVVSALLLSLYGCDPNPNDSSLSDNGYSDEDNSNGVVLTKDNYSDYMSVHIVDASNVGNTFTFKIILDLGNAKKYSNLDIAINVNLGITFVDSDGINGNHSWQTMAMFKNTHSITKSVFYNSSRSIHNVIDYYGSSTSIISVSGKLYY